MNYTQTFEEFSKGVSTMDLALYAGAGIVLWVLFKDKLSPVARVVQDAVNLIKKKITTTTTSTSAVSTTVSNTVSETITPNNDLFFSLVTSWKQTRDLAVKTGCEEAVRVADQMFPYLSPNVCEDKTNE